MKSYVYVATDGRYFKIGASTFPLKRAKELSQQFPNTGIVYALCTNDRWEGTDLEKAMHRHFARFCVTSRGREWFNLSLLDIEADTSVPFYSMELEKGVVGQFES